MGEGFDPAARARSFGFAIRGVVTLIRDEPNARIHLAATALVIGLGGLLDVDADGWRWLIVAIALVWIAEAANTAVERVADAAVPERHPLIGRAKDVAAGGVLIAALAAAAIGLGVLGRPLLSLLAVHT